ncbi:MAG: hypothetical protein Q7T55_13215 [Solirubrobacteraceae bacterium]|nr:hypothetical protein [Solirubrobacteraceae bacterium]
MPAAPLSFASVARVARAGLLALAFAGAAVSSAQAETIEAPSAASFRDSIGVGTHFDFGGYAYQQDSVANLQSALRGLGIRHLRDHGCFNTEAICSGVRSRIAAMGDTFGENGPKVGVDLIAAPLAAKPSARADRDAEILRTLRGIRDSPVAGMTEGLEMVNEPDLRGGDWAAQALADANTINRLLATPEFAGLRSIPRLAPAMGRPTSSPELVNAGWTKGLADIANAHPYPMPYDTPERTGITNACTTGRTVMDCATDLAGSSKTIATEAGYSTAGNVFKADWVSPEAQATYTLRMLLHNFAAGVPRTYLYELLNLEVQQLARNHGYGLLQVKDTPAGKAVGAPKPVYHAIANLNKRIGDLGAPAMPGSIDLSLTDASSGAALPASQIEKVVLRRADGTYVLAVWQPVKVWQHTTSGGNYSTRDLAATPRNVTVSLDASRGTWDVRRFTPVTVPADGDDFRQAYAGVGAVTFAVDEDVTLLELTPPDPLVGPTAPSGSLPGSTVPENALPGTTIVQPVTLAPLPAADSGAANAPAAVTTPRTDAPRPAAASRTAAPASLLPDRDRAAEARERASRLGRARIRARRAYAACLDRRVATAQRRMRARSARLHPSRPTKEMRARCGRLLAR